MSKKISTKDYAVALHESTQGLKGKDLHEVIHNFVALLAREQKLKQAEKIIAEFVAYAKKQEGIRDISISSAHELDTKAINAIKKSFGEKVEATHVVDESLIAGFVVKTDDKIFDASLQKQLVKLKEKINQ